MYKNRTGPATVHPVVEARRRRSAQGMTAADLDIFAMSGYVAPTVGTGNGNHSRRKVRTKI